MRWLDSIHHWNLSKLQEMLKVRGAWRATVQGVAKSQTWLRNWRAMSGCLRWTIWKFLANLQARSWQRGVCVCVCVCTHGRTSHPRSVKAELHPSLSVPRVPFLTTVCFYPPIFSPSPPPSFTPPPRACSFGRGRGDFMMKEIRKHTLSPPDWEFFHCLAPFCSLHPHT